MIKDCLVEAFINIKKVNRLKYKELSEMTNLRESQISNILNHGGKLVSAEKIEDALNRIGFYVEPLNFNLTEDDAE